MDLTALNEGLEGMDAAEVALGAGFAGLVLGIMAIGTVVWFFVSAFGFYKMNQKAGQAGWKAFVPYYAAFIRFKYAWEPKMFYVYMAGLIFMNVAQDVESFLVSFASLIIAIISLVVKFKLDVNTAKSFGKTAGWGALLFFLPFVGSLILGFGKAQYQGNAGMKRA